MKARLLLLILISFIARGQQYGNEWIDYAQKYYAFPIWQTGIYRIFGATLQSAGVPIASINSSQVQIFGRQREIPIYVEDGGDGVLDSTDYIEFYAEKNDGWLDSVLYENPLKMGNPGYSLYNDTIRYFFTWKNAGVGKRFVVESDINYSAYTPNNYVLTKTIHAPNDAYIRGYIESGLTSSFYVDGEGYGNDPVNGVSATNSTSINLATPNFYVGADAPSLNLKVNVSSTASATNVTPNHHVQLNFAGNNILDQIYAGYQQIQFNGPLSYTWISSSTTNLTMQVVNDLGAATDWQSLSYAELTYPHTLNFPLAFVQCFVPFNTTQSKSRLDLTGLSGASHVAYILGQYPKKIPIVEGTTDYLLIPNSLSGEQQKLLVINTTSIQAIAQLKAVNGSGFFTNYAVQNFENAVLMIYNEALLPASTDYKNYRTLVAGGNFNVVFANVKELYMQFGGGIRKHILGIRRFAHYAYNHSTQKPKALFLMGKGVSDPGYRIGLNTLTNYALCLIPSFGYPSSDICITAKLEGNKLAPLIPTGRVAVRNNQQLSDYLNKVKENRIQQDPFSIYNSPNKDWQKHILHFGGGTGASQQQQLQNYLNQMGNIAEHEYFGGHVTSYFKTTEDPFDPATVQEIRDRLQQGVSLVTFFDHATSDGFEINLDEPSNWDNQGKYPLILGNACYTGDIFHGGSVLSASEKFVQVPARGAIAFLSSASLGFAPYLFYYSREFYRQFSLINYGATLGEQIKNTVDVVEEMTQNLIMESTCTHMVLNGDPLVRLNPHNKPEIELLESNVTFLPHDLDLTTENITVQVIITNLGQSITDSISVVLKRDFPGLQVDSVFHKTLPRLDYKDTLVFTMLLHPNVSLGPNLFTITVDLPSFIDEQYDEVMNNKITKTLFVNINGILPVLPYDFAVVPKDSVTVKASTVNALAGLNTYRFEIDTTDLFNSPQKRFAIVVGTGGVKTVQPNEWISASTGIPMPLVCPDSMVYFWRVAIDSTSPLWHEQSFQYIKGKEGWGQDHFFQFKKNEFISVNYDRTNRNRTFDPITKYISCDVYDHATADEYGATDWHIDQNLQEYAVCGYTNSIHVGIVDPVTFEAWGTRYYNTTTSTWENPTHNFGNANDNGTCRPRSERYFIFRQNNAAQMTAFENMMSAIPDSFYILIYTPFYAAFDTWSPSTFNMFSSVLHSDSIYPGRPNQAFIFFGKKGTGAYNVELVAQYDHEFLHLNTLMHGSIYSGVENSTVIGPAGSWDRLYWKQHPSEPTIGDSTTLRITALDANHSSIFSIDTLFTQNDSIVNLSTLVDANIYPYLKLSALYDDEVTFTPAQLDRWHVLYGQLPEAALDASNGYYWELPQDTLQEGQVGRFAIDIKNIGEIDMDSLLVKYWILDDHQVKHYIPYPRQDSLLVGETFRDTITFSTLGLSGLNSFWVEVNPYINGSTTITDQPEQFHFNNVAQIEFNVKNDNKNPTLDVTFDGVHILNGDIVSPKSQIVISLKDDNPYLLMSEDADTSLFGIYLKDPNGVQKRIPFMNAAGQPVLQWIPATSTYNKFKIIYQGDFKMDGIYTLSVQGADKSGNLSGDFDYRITFEVIHESSITYLMNYPNPFSTKTRFVFTLTGEKIPDHMIIQIMTITGKVVREITQAELGPIRIGKNITEYAWDGKDEFGDFLANGVYLYRVLTDLDNESIKHRESGADKYFKKEFGKMYLMR